jgi:hypothetical protein
VTMPDEPVDSERVDPVKPTPGRIPCNIFLVVSSPEPITANQPLLVVGK